ncbi:MAG: 16S rRNA (guanine(527)-N(7))-methyltransferase RsmG [Butyricicoccus pullicaecorum]|nr:16S rRNA (guanine(527)-N(7))-methyltransferase RsmG [Butyricicoccus pullicaecorum]MDO4668292.1 16S rRNA (guanine(527)-N(7))-methyltransferase RsmG [Butyricicoccus pullicaecorum]
MTERELLTQGLETLGMNDTQAVDKLLVFSDLLLEKNKVMNLTAVKEPMEVVTRHFLDCAPLAQYAAGKKVIDVGCGAGFPGMPIALLTDAQVTLLDSLGKRIVFLKEVIDTLYLENVQAVHARAEEFGHREHFDLATSRAVARLNILAELSLPLVKVGGYFIAMKAVGSDDEIARAKNAIRLLGGQLERVLDYEVPMTQDRKSRLVFIRKVRETPEKYPRRFQKISAQPL